MNRLISYFVERSFIVNLIAIFICLVGYIAMTSMKRSLIPEWSSKRVSIDVYLPGASAEEMERLVTYPIETAVKGFAGVEEMLSTSRFERAGINLIFEDGYDNLEAAVENIRARVMGIRHKIPESVRTISVERIKKESEFLMFVALQNANEENDHHRRQVRKLSRSLEKIKGVISANVYMRNREVVVNLQPDKLKFYGLSAIDVRKGISQYRRYSPVGRIKDSEEVYNIEVLNSVGSLLDLSKIPLSSNRSGYSVSVGDLANVEYGLSEQNAIRKLNGQKAIFIRIVKDLSSDTLNLRKKVGSVLDKFNQEDVKTKSPLKVKVVVDAPAFISSQLDILKINGILGIIFVFIVLLFFLNWRTALMTVLGLPVAYFGTFIVLSYLGISIDLVSIVGMLLILGILVDDAIIVSEKYVALLADGLQPKDAAIKAVRVLILPVTGTILTTVVAFSPMLLIQSGWSDILYAIPVVVIVALILSWVESFFILPNHLRHFVKKEGQKRFDVFSKVRLFYERILRMLLNYRYVVLILGLSFIILSGYIGFKKVKHRFGLHMGLQRVNVTVVLKKSPSFVETEKKIQPLSDYLTNISKGKVDAVRTRIGSIWNRGKRLEGERYARFSLYVDKTAKHPQEIKEKLKKAILKDVKKFKTKDFEKLIVDGQREGEDESKGNLVSVEIRGAEDIGFTDIEKVIVKQAMKSPGIKELSINENMYQEAWRFQPNHQALRQYGLTPSSLANQIRGFFTKNFLDEIRLHGEFLDLYTKIAINSEIRFDTLQSFYVVSSKGIKVPLSLLGEWISYRSLKNISHVDGSRHLTLDFKVQDEEKNISPVIEGLKKTMISVQDKFPTYNIRVVEADDKQRKGKKWALKVALVCISGVLLVLALVLGSLSQPFFVALPIPFGLAGIIWALYIHNLPLGLMAVVGVVGVVGVAVNDSLIMVDGINQLTRDNEGEMNRDLLIQGASQRLRAIILTTVTTLGGVLPMAYSLGGESGFTQPLAFSIGWGLLFSTLMTLLILPAFLEIREDILALGRRFLTKKKVDG